MTALREQIRVFTDARLSPAARAAALASAARGALADALASGQASPVYVRYVDGRQGADEDSVRGDGRGQIIYQFGYIGQAALYALAFLRARAPVRSGEFRDSFYLGVNGRMMAAEEFNPDRVPAGAEVAIINTQPYSRKVDIQTEGGKSIRFSVPPGLFSDTVRAVRRRYPAIQIRRVYTLRFPGQYILRGGSRAGTAVNSPAIVMSQRSLV